MPAAHSYFVENYDRLPRNSTWDKNCCKAVILWRATAFGWSRYSHDKRDWIKSESIPEIVNLTAVDDSTVELLRSDIRAWTWYFLVYRGEDAYLGGERPGNVLRLRVDSLGAERFDQSGRWVSTPWMVDFRNSGLVTDPPWLVETDIESADRLITEIFGVEGATLL